MVFFAHRERHPLPRSAYIHVVADDEKAAASSRRGQKALFSWRAIFLYFEDRSSSTVTTRSCRPLSTTVYASSRETARDTERTADRRREKTKNDTAGLAFANISRHRDRGVSVRVIGSETVGGEGLSPLELAR